MLEGSRGWQMRHPVRVRAVEFDRVVGDGRLAETEHAVFTRAPDVLWTRRLYPGPSIPIPPLNRLFPRLTDLASYAATMRDPDALADQRNAADGWIAQWTRISEFLEREQAGADRTHEVTFGAVLADLAEDLLLRAPVEQLTRWLDESARTDVAAMPYMSRTMWVMFARLRNRTGRWQRSDFIDLMFLPCASAYADVVIGERRTIADLRRATLCPAGAELATGLIEGLPLIEARLGAWVSMRFPTDCRLFRGQIRRGSPSEGLRMALRASPIENDYY